jgi:hypothetical protein
MPFVSASMRLGPWLALGVLLAGCEDPGWQQQLEGSAIHQALTVNYEESTQLLRATAELRRGGAAGEAVTLEPGEGLFFNGVAMNLGAGVSASSYGYSQIGTRSLEQRFVFRTADRGDLENRIAWAPVSVLSANASTPRTEPRIALSVLTPAFTAGDQIELTLRQSRDGLELGTALEVLVSATIGGNLQIVGTVPTARLPAFAAGAATVMLSRVRERQVEQGTSAGGTIRAIYRAAPIPVTLTD